MLRLSVFIKMLVIVCIVACACSGAIAQQDTGYQTSGEGSYLFTYRSVVLDAPIKTYDYYLENDSLDYEIVSWTWEFDGITYNVMPNPSATCDADSYSFPLPCNPSGEYESYSWREEYSNNTKTPMEINSIVKFDEDHKYNVLIYVPNQSSGVVPEPSALVALSSGLIGLVARRRK